MIRLEIGDNDVGKLDIVLGQAHHLLGESGDAMAQGLIAGATLGPAPRRRVSSTRSRIDNWTSATYQAVLTVAPEAAPEFTPDIESRVWSALERGARAPRPRRRCGAGYTRATAPLPAVSADWRLKSRGGRPAVADQPGSARARGRWVPVPGRPHLRQPGRARRLQRPGGTPAGFPVRNAFAVLPLPGARLRDTAVRTPDFVVIGNGRAVVIEVDGPHHSGRIAEPTTPTATCTGGGAASPQSASPASTPATPGASKPASRKSSSETCERPRPLRYGTPRSPSHVDRGFTVPVRTLPLRCLHRPPRPWHRPGRR